MYRFFVKPLFDKLVAIILIIILAPIFLFSMLLLMVDLREWNVLFCQKRPGFNEKIFTIIKLKTMRSTCDLNGNLLPDNQRITHIGKIIRCLSLDELPQLLLVLFGKMSLIGPRPLMIKYLPLYSKEQHKRHLVKPGITGWAQVNGRNTLSWYHKFEYDVYYVDHLSFMLDLRIFFLTIHKIIHRSDINQKGKVTVDAFNGTN